MPPRPRFDRRAPVRELPNINERIKYPQLRVVDSDGKQLGVIDRLKALEIASQRELDLVLVSEKANPPVCRIMDYGKYKFEQEKKAKEATHAIQNCNDNKTIGDIKKLESKLHQSKRKALEFSSSNFFGTYAKEVEAYVLEDKPKKVKNLIKKYCL